MHKINFIIDDKQTISKDEMQVTYGYVNNNNIPSYSESIWTNLKNTLKTQDNLVSILSKIQNFINLNNEYDFSILALKKGTKNFENFVGGDKQEMRNVAFIFKFKEKILYEKFNSISIVCDVKKSKNNKLCFNLFTKQIELFDWKHVQFEPTEEKFEINFVFNDNDAIVEPVIFKNRFSQNFTGDDDFQNDILSISQWFTVLKCLKDKYNGLNEEDDFWFFKLNDESFAMSKFNNSLKNNCYLVQTIDKSNLDKEVDFHKSLISEIKKDYIFNIFNKTIEIYKNDIEKNKQRIGQEQNNLKIKLNEYKEIKEQISNLNTKETYLKNNSDESDKKLKQELQEIKKQIDKFNNNLNNNKDQQKSIKNTINNLEKENESLDEKIKNKTVLLNNFKSFTKENKTNYFYKVNKIVKADSDDGIEYDYCDELIDIFDHPNFKDLLFTIISKNDAKKALINRNFFALKKLNEGIHKDPYLYKSIKEPTLISNEEVIISEDTIKKFPLNNNQLESVKRCLNTNHIFYLQGPPGTGKTQTIGAIANETINNNKNVVICSSTHETISNFLERLDNANKDNPNLIIFKYQFVDKNVKKKENEFSEEKLYPRFKQKIYNHIIGDQQENQIDILDYLNKSENKEILNISSKSELKLFVLLFMFNVFKKALNLRNIELEKIYQLILNPDINDECIWPFDNYIYEPNDISIETINEVYDNTKKHFDKKSLCEASLFDEMNNVIAELVNKYVDATKNINQYNSIKNFSDLTYSQLLNFVENDSKSDFKNVIKSIKNHFENNNTHKNKCYETSFLDYIFEKEYINVVGITTTSKQTIKIKDKEKNLFSDYLIDLMIVDEVSKSTTPEIVSKLVLAKKTVLSGDYLQLPPNCDLDDNDYEYLKENCDYYNDYYEDDESDFEYSDEDFEEYEPISIEDVKNDIEELFKNSFFKFQIVNKIKKSSTNLNKKPYCYLNESNRFHGGILKPVNLIYEKNGEALKEPSNFKLEDYYRNNLVDFKVHNKNYSVKDFIIVDLNKIDDNFINEHDIPESKKIQQIKSFDQSGLGFENKKFNLKFSGHSLFNQYSAWVITKIVENLLKNNNENNFKKIGIIALTKTQKKIINEYLSKNDFIHKNKNRYKVDTIDAFQGREEDVIIVDFIRGETKITSRKIVQSNKRNISFLGSPERINVAISRPRKKLILVGFFSNYLINEKEFNIDKYGNLFEQYFDIANENDSIINATDIIKEYYEN